MPMFGDQRVELELFEAEVKKRKPADLLQFSANYFNRRLEQQRSFARRQETLASSKGIVLFPAASEQECGAAASLSLEESESGGVEKPDVAFKSPFAGDDPHSTHGSGPAAGLFKGNFDVGKEPASRSESPMCPRHDEEPKAKKANANFQPLPTNFNAERRTSVSAETFQPSSLDNWVPPHYVEKNKQQLQRLLKAVGGSFLFNKLDQDSRKLVVNALEEKKVPKGTEVIKQGDEGDFFYVVEEGTVDFYVNHHKVNTSGPGSSFGELALMYNNPRASTVIAKTDCVLWALDRLTFRKILLGSSFQKRLMYDELLKSMPILKSLTTYDRAKLADALDTELYEPGQVIIREGDVGENFYLIEYGECDVSKKGKGVINHLKSHDYFGEIALLKDLPRQATVTATKKTKVATLGKSGFQRLLGPAVDVLKLNDPTRVQESQEKDPAHA
ncbi:BN860_02146g1_1 [Zygosaccharomyces bailii CLIB 213]|uniref:cAMP-dependent protein kinase regulatory subunit n=1 Tax=Zygosaccharomyces bailii (strain CLIB 213 / ATCC 58445 / CBS 680 / BCRC 21525 / NBRC 1098 / NCYC 1416 / NRRL Y-2227) TaxID=1333698 RepID=A0A8J2T4K8_ZYGB2|nr:BN860_02146g1_1 [Zygosaccharomyces bailii CLIB 213]